MALVGKALLVDSKVGKPHLRKNGYCCWKHQLQKLWWVKRGSRENGAGVKEDATGSIDPSTAGKSTWPTSWAVGSMMLEVQEGMRILWRHPLEKSVGYTPGWKSRELVILHPLIQSLIKMMGFTLKQQLLVSGQPKEFPPPVAHTSGSRCCNCESWWFVFGHMTQLESPRSSVEREACSLFGWTWAPRMWVTSAQGHDQGFQFEAKPMEDGANRLGRGDDITPLFFWSQHCALQNFSYINQELLIFVYFLLHYYCVCTHMCECMPHIHV